MREKGVGGKKFGEEVKGDSAGERGEKGLGKGVEVGRVEGRGCGRRSGGRGD